MQKDVSQAQMLWDDRQFSADKWSVIMTLMSLHATRQLFVRNKIWDFFFLKDEKTSLDKSLCIINEKETGRKRQINAVNES